MILTPCCSKYVSYKFLMYSLGMPCCLTLLLYAVAANCALGTNFAIYDCSVYCWLFLITHLYHIWLIFAIIHSLSFDFHFYLLLMYVWCVLFCVGSIYIFWQNWYFDKKCYGISKMQRCWNCLWVRWFSVTISVSLLSIWRHVTVSFSSND